MNSRTRRARNKRIVFSKSSLVSHGIVSKKKELIVVPKQSPTIPLEMSNKVKWILAENLVDNKIDFKSMEEEYGPQYTHGLLKTLIGNQESRWYFQMKGVLDDVDNYLTCCV